MEGLLGKGVVSSFSSVWSHVESARLGRPPPQETGWQPAAAHGSQAALLRGPSMQCGNSCPGSVHVCWEVLLTV